MQLGMNYQRRVAQPPMHNHFRTTAKGCLFQSLLRYHWGHGIATTALPDQIGRLPSLLARRTITPATRTAKHRSKESGQRSSGHNFDTSLRFHYSTGNEQTPIRLPPILHHFPLRLTGSPTVPACLISTAIRNQQAVQTTSTS